MRKVHKYPFIIQHDERDCGAACLSMIAEYYGKKLKLETCRNLIKVDSKGASIYGLEKGAEKIGFQVESFQADLEDLKKEIKEGNVKLPIIVRIISEERFEHFCVLYEINDDNVIMGNPADTKIRRLTIPLFSEIWLGQLVTFNITEDFKEDNERVPSLLRFIGDLKGQGRFIIFGLLASIVILLINLAGAYLFRFILSDSYNSFLLFGNIIVDGIEKICIALVLLYIFRMIVEVMRCNVLTHLSKQLSMSITMKLYMHLVRIDIPAYEARQTGDFISRFFDTEKIKEALTSVILSAMLDSGMAIICGIILYNLNTKLFLISLVTISIYIMILKKFKDLIRKTNNDIMASEALVTSALKESIDGIETIKAYNLENKNTAVIGNLYEKSTNKILRGTRIVNKQIVLTAFVSSIGIVCVMGFGYKEYIRGTLSLADLFTFYYMLDYFMGPVAGLINLQPDIETAVIAADRVNDILDISKEHYTGEGGLLKGDIVFQDVTFRYGYNEAVLNNFNLIIEEGSKIAITGESGSGKTTIAKLIMGFYSPEKGSIYIGNKEIKDCGVDTLRNSIAYVSQEPFLFEDSLYNNLIVGNPNIEASIVDQIIGECGLRDFIYNLPFGYDTLISEGGRNLSGGQKQRIAIARALISRKKILILDEATSNLDSNLERLINEIISRLPNDVTCITITHHREMVDICDKVIEL